METINIFLIIINMIAFFLMGYDKEKSLKNKRRISEKTLFALATIGGSLGIFLGMLLFHHKTKKHKFITLITLILTIELILVMKAN